ncbi:MAG: hypothetical protein V3S24_12955 [Candidatus Tectomicrobia bacterium]
MVARLHARRDTSKGPVAVRAIFWRCAAFLTCALATEPICVHMVASLELVPPATGGWGLWERQAARRLAASAPLPRPIRIIQGDDIGLDEVIPRANFLSLPHLLSSN